MEPKTLYGLCADKSNQDNSSKQEINSENCATPKMGNNVSDASTKQEMAVLVSASLSGNKIQKDLGTSNVHDERSNQGQEKDDSQRSSRKNQFISEMK